MILQPEYVQMLIFGYNKTVKVQLVPFAKTEDEAAIPAELLLKFRKLAKAIKEIKKYKGKLEEVVGKTETFTEKGLDVVMNGQTYNEEDPDSRNFYSVKEWELKLVGSIGTTFKFGGTSILPNVLKKYIDIYAYAGISLDAEYVRGEKLGKLNNISRESLLEKSIKVQGIGGVKVGATAKINAGTLANIDFDANGKGEIEVSKIIGNNEVSITLKPVVFNFSAVVTAFEVEIIKYNFIKNLTNEYKIY